MSIDSDARDARLQALYAAGHTGAQIGEIEGMTDGGVYKALRRLGVSARRDTRQMSAEQIAEILRLYAGGATPTEIGARFSMTKAKVVHALRRGGAMMRSRGSGRLSLHTQEALDARNAQFAAQRAAGKTLAQIASEAGITRQAVFAALKARDRA